MFLGVALRSLGSRRMQAKSKERVRDAGYSPRRSGPESLKRARPPTSASPSPPMRTPSSGEGRHGLDISCHRPAGQLRRPLPARRPLAGARHPPRAMVSRPR
jgi:hypothetical protein